MATGEKRATLHGHPNQFLCVAFSPDGKKLATGGEKSIAIWDVASTVAKSTLIGHNGVVTALRFAPGGQTLASGDTHGMVKLWDYTDGKGRELMGSNLENNRILGLAFSPDGLMLAAGSMTRGTRLWSAVTCQESDLS